MAPLLEQYGTTNEKPRCAAMLEMLSVLLQKWMAKGNLSDRFCFLGYGDIHTISREEAKFRVPFLTEITSGVVNDNEAIGME